MDMQADNPIFGKTNNPWDTSRTSGGSSGGCATALATGMTPLSFGNDLAGSIRLPSAYCGVYGFKPYFWCSFIEGNSNRPETEK
jgi:amidase